MKKFLTCFLYLIVFFCHHTFADNSQISSSMMSAVQFDPSTNTWPSTLAPINNMNFISGIITLGKNSFAYGCASESNCKSPFGRGWAPFGGNLVAFNNGSGWQNPQLIQGIEIIPPFVAQYPDTYQSPAAWIIGANDKKESDYLLSYFDGKTFSPAVSFPFASEPPGLNRPPFFLESHHLGFAIDYKSNRVFWTTDTKWNMAASLPTGSIVAATTDKLNDDLYLLGLDTSKNPNQYFITHLLGNNQWEKPLYINFMLPNTPLNDILVMNGGKNICVLAKFTTGLSIFISQNGGQNFIYTGIIPYLRLWPSSFMRVYNGNKAHIFSTIYSVNAPYGYDDTIAYLDPNAKSPAWTKVSLPENISVSDAVNFPWRPTGDDGSQLWIYGHTADQQFMAYYYDIKLERFINAPIDGNNRILFLEAMNQGKAFGLGFDQNKNWAGFFFNGNDWKIVSLMPATPSFLMYPSGGFKASWGYPKSVLDVNKYIVDDSTKNIWLFTAQRVKR